MMRTRKAYSDTKSRRAERHTFWFKTKNKKVAARARVKTGKIPFWVDLIESNVLEAVKRNGEGDGQNCAGAVCLEGADTPFLYTGYPDFQTTRAYFSTRNDARDFPVNCVAYAHDAPFVSKLFDTKQYNQLISKIRKAGGRLRINFFPIPPTRISPNRNSGSANASGRKSKLRGHKLRLFRRETGNV